MGIVNWQTRLAGMRPEIVAEYADTLRTAYAAPLAARYGTLDAAPGAAWYAQHAATLDAARGAVPYAVACGIIGVSSINTEPNVGERWAIATMHGRTGGHLGIACERAARMLALPADVPFSTVRDIACDPNGDARKVRSFACNHATFGRDCDCADGPCVTIDRWAARAASGGVVTGVPRGTAYAEFAAAYRIVAAEYGIPASMLQAVVWVAIRGAE